MLDLFILHARAEADTTFARAQLVPELGLASDRVLLSSELPLGMTVIEAIERGVAASRMTVAVVSPAFLHDGWSVFGETLAGYHATRGGVLMPLILFDCALPLRLDFRVQLDCRAPADRPAAIARLRAQLDLPAPVERDIPCPYPGMRPFTRENAALFCGRDREVDDLVSRVAGGLRELYVIGPSGSGKSSLLLSAVAPRLERADAVVREPFTVRVMRPGAQPAERLSAAIADVDAAHPLLIIDQLEEIFTLADADARRAFFTALDELRRSPTWALAFTVRADFYGSLMQSELWPFVRRAHRHEVDPLRGDALRGAITLPARRVGVELEPALLDRLLADAANEPGSLPLVQETLVHLWTKRDANLLALARYEELGDGTTSGLAAALARRADTALAALDDTGQAIARRIFLRLVSFGEGRADTRRQQALSVLGRGEDPARFEATLRHLIDQRLLTADATIATQDDGTTAVSETLVDLAHEVAIESWPTLHAWVTAGRKHEQRRRALEAKAEEWVTAERRSRYLDAAELAEIDGWLEEPGAHDVGLGVDATRLIEDSRDRLEAEARMEIARRRLVRRSGIIALVTLLTAFVLVSTLAVFAILRSREARTQARRATEQGAVAAAKESEARLQLARNYRLQAQTLLMNSRRAQALPLLVAAREAGLDDDVTHRLFRWAAQDVPVALVHGADLTQVAWSPDGTRIATGTANGETRLWNATTGALLWTLPQQVYVWSIAWSPDGRRLVSASSSGQAHIVDAATGTVVPPLLEHASFVLAAAWSPDGVHIATGSADKTARIWDAASGRLEATLRHGGSVVAVAWSPDGARVATASDDGTARVWDARGTAMTPPLPGVGEVRAIAWSADGAQLATLHASDRAQIWDAHALGRPPSSWPLQDRDASHRLVWNQGRAIDDDAPARTIARRFDGSELTLAGSPGTLAWFDSASEGFEALAEGGGTIVAASSSPDGARVVTASADHIARVYDLDRLPVSMEHGATIVALLWSVDGAAVVSGAIDGTARVWDARRGRMVTSVAPGGWVTELRWSADGSDLETISTAADGQTLRAWDPHDGTPRSQPSRYVRPRTEEHLIGDTHLEVTVYDHALSVLNLTNGDLRTIDHAGPPSSLAWSPDGSRVAMSSDGTTVSVVDPIDGRLLSPPLDLRESVEAVAWSPDGDRLATGGVDNVQIWDVRTGLVVAHVGVDRDATIGVLAWSPDGRHLAAGSITGYVRVWDLATDEGTLADWRAVFAWCPYALNADGVLTPRALADPIRTDSRR